MNGTVQRTVDYDSTGVIVSEEKLFQNNLVETTRSFERGANDYNTETINFPDGSQAVRQLFKDGSLYQQTGSAVLPMSYEQTSAAGETHATMWRLKLTESKRPSGCLVDTEGDGL